MNNGLGHYLSFSVAKNEMQQSKILMKSANIVLGSILCNAAGATITIQCPAKHCSGSALTYFSLSTKYKFFILQDFCYDKEDGGTQFLTLRLMTTNRRELPPSSWLQFDSRNQVLLVYWYKF